MRNLHDEYEDPTMKVVFFLSTARRLPSMRHGDFVQPWCAFDITQGKAA